MTQGLPGTGVFYPVARQRGRTSGTDIDATDYEELALDDLVVRLIAEELAARTGVTVSLPKAPATTTTNPPGQ